ncbi:unnamed protein product, partial [marine sediment metagenome]
MLKLKSFLVSGCLVSALFLGSQLISHQESGQVSPETTPMQLWERCQKTLPPLSYDILKDKVVPSDTDPAQTLRRLEVRFCSQVAGQWRHRMEHTAVILIPSESRIYKSPKRKGKVVVVSHAYGDKTVEGNYGEPIVARMGYPT